MSTAENIFEKAKAGYPALYLLSSEEQRALQEIQAAATKAERTLYVWTLTEGIVKSGSSKPIAESDNPSGCAENMGTSAIANKGILVIKNYHHFLDDPGIQTRILNTVRAYKTSSRMLILLSPVMKLPPELEKEFAMIEMSLPNEKELDPVLQGIIDGSKMSGDAIPSTEMRKQLVKSALGLTTSEAESAFSLAYARPKINKSPNKWDPSVVLEEKCNTLKKSGLLTYYPPGNQGMSQVGGMANLKDWIGKRKRAFTIEATKFGLPAPKGILMVGPPGSGKSLGARAISEELGLPLLRCDMGRIFAGLVGASEENARKVVQTAEAVAPCVLWLDEIEKGFAGSGAGNLDSGVGSRVLGTFLTWMQEKTSPVFVYATANNVQALPPELLRKGRFDDTFSVMLPTEEERREIFTIHLTKRKREGKIKPEDLERLVKGTEDWSGAEIEAAITESMFTAFSNNRDITHLDVQTAIDETVPLSKMMKAQIEAMQAWCKDRTRPANAAKKAHAKVGGRAVEA